MNTLRRAGALITALLLCSCAPTVREALTIDTANYTRCDHVEVDCVDEACSNVAGGPWMATACATRYRCTRTADQVVCVPQPAGAAPAASRAVPTSSPEGSWRTLP